MNWNGYGRKQMWSNGTKEKTTKKKPQDTCCPSRDSNQAPLGYKSRVLLLHKPLLPDSQYREELNTNAVNFRIN
jgi:hypothetical protein